MYELLNLYLRLVFAQKSVLGLTFDYIYILLLVFVFRHNPYLQARGVERNGGRRCGYADVKLAPGDPFVAW